MEHKKRKGIWIPIEILIDKNLDAANKIILSEIYSLCELPKGCTAGDLHLADLANLSRTAVTNRIKKLEELGYFEKIVIKGKGKILKKKSRIKTNSILFEASPIVKTDVPVMTPTCQEITTLGVGMVTPTCHQDNTINTYTNSLLIQKLNQYTGANLLNTGNTMHNTLLELYQDLAYEIGTKSSLGIDVFNYSNIENIKYYKDAVDPEEYALVFPLLNKFIDLDARLHGS